MKIRKGDIIRWNWGIELDCSTIFVVLDIVSSHKLFKVYSIQESDSNLTGEMRNNEIIELSYTSFEKACEKGHTEKIFDITSTETKNE